MKTAFVTLMFASLAAAADMKDNWIYFDTNGTATVSFAAESHSITEGQPWGGVSSQKNGILVKAGRQGSAGVAAAFVTGVTIVNVLVTDHVIDALPHDMNFAIFGNLTVSFSTGETAVCDNFRLGQGHHETSNNWWMGSERCTSVPTTQKMTCFCKGTNLVFKPEGDNDRMYVLPGN
eukprot:TRINITY_DN1416_c0_g1_i5.p1 TRINITY_DN1416_c0_g1~~TRINITY_DN1416_c0_g1_i5.p1  ORF type:complete len:177 (+),score=55.19 TRINITY_DN1416_c0_g1_i5:364-894(+)